MIRARVRSTGERGIGWFLLFSLSMHGLFLVVVLLHRKPVSLGYQNATTVSLVSEDVLRHPAQSQTSKLTAPKIPVKITPAPKPVKVAHPVIQQKPVSKTIPKVTSLKLHRHSKPVHERKIQAVRKKVLVSQKTALKKDSKAIPPKPQSIHPPKKTLTSTATQTVPVLMDVVGQRFPTYLQHLLISRIKSNWAPPPGSHGLNATVHFVLKKDGTLAADPALVTSSGSRVFDDAARYAILRSVPFPPFPPSYGRNQEDVTVTLQATKRQGF